MSAQRLQTLWQIVVLVAVFMIDVQLPMRFPLTSPLDSVSLPQAHMPGVLRLPPHDQSTSRRTA
jgi:hypothetical protein